MHIEIVLNQYDLKKLVKQEIERQIGKVVAESEIKIKVRSSQNFRNKEWESGEFQASYTEN